MMRITSILALVVSGLFSLSAQDISESVIQHSNTTEDSWEVGLHAGHAFSAGNIDFTPSYGAGLHLRKALDYVFSVRINLTYSSLKGEDPGNIRNFEGTFMSGSIQAIANLNNLKWDLVERKTALYAFGGFGLNSFEAEVFKQDAVINTVESDMAPHVDLGAGIAFKINKNVNIGIEHQASFLIGKRADLLDGVETLMSSEERSTFRDLFNYTNVRVNFNLTGKDNKTEPLYWLNPLDAVLADVQKLKDTRVTINDDDGDGVIDMLDEEENTPEGAIVNAKGITQDSDGDGIANHEDKEPYSPKTENYDAEGVAQLPDLMAKVETLLEERLKNFESVKTQPEVPSGVSAAAWYLPAIYFPSNQSNITAVNIGVLANVATVINANPNLKFAVIGHTDQSGSDHYNDTLSYLRAKNVIDYLTDHYKVSRAQLILIWKGEVDKLTEGTHEVNRRVQFKVATNETEMAAPQGNN